MITTTGIEETARMFERIASGAPRSEAAAVNAAGRFLRRGMLRDLATDTGMSSASVGKMKRNGIRATPAIAADPVYTLRVGTRTLQIISLKAKETATGVSFRLRGTQQEIPGAFIEESNIKKGRGVFKRTGSPRLPIPRRFAEDTLADLAEPHVASLVTATEQELRRRLEDEFLTVTRSA